MRVLAVDHTGGVDVFRERYRVLSTDPDIDLTVFVPETWVEGGRVVRAGRDASGYRVLTGKAGFRGYENRGFFYTGVRRALRTARPDVLQLMEEPYSLMALQFALLSRRMYPATRIIFYTFDNLNTGFRYPCRPSWFYGGVQRIVQRVSDCGLVSSGEARRVLESRGFTRPIRHVPFGVDPERFCKREVGRTRSERGLREFVIGFAGRLIPAKGVRVLLEALSFLRMDWSLLVVGGGPEAGAVRACARGEGWENRLVIDDNVTHGEVPDRMNLMDVLVLPSLTTPTWKEQFGRVLIEAMACEVPVVGSDSGAIPEVIGDAGVIVPEGDAATLARALQELHHDRRMCARLAAAGRERVLRHFTWRRVVEAHKGTYAGLLDGTLESERIPEWSMPSS